MCWCGMLQPAGHIRLKVYGLAFPLMIKLCEYRPESRCLICLGLCQ